MMNYEKLRQAIVDSNLTGTDQEIKTALELKNIDIVKNIEVVEIKRYLILTGKLPAIRESDTLACKLAIEAFNTFDEFNMSDQTNAAALSDQMDGLVQSGIIDLSDKAYVLSLGQAKESILAVNQLGKVTIGDIQKARA